MTQLQQADFIIDRSGSIIGITPMNQDAREWLDENVQSEGWQWLGETLNVDIRMAGEVVAGMQAAGLNVE